MKYLMMILAILAASGCFPAAAPNLNDRQDALAMVDNGVLLLREGDLERAGATFEMAYQLSGGAEALDGLGCVAFMSGDLKSAEEYFWRAYEVDSSYNNSLGNLAMLYESRGDMKKAEELYRRAVTEDPKNFRSRNNFAAFMADKSKGKTDKGSALSELLKAEALARHPLIQDNIRKISSER